MKTYKDRQTGPTHAWLLSQIEAFMDLNDMSPDGGTFGWYVKRDSSLVTRLRDGKEVSTGTLDEILAFMKDPVTVTRNGEPKALNLKPLNVKRRILQ